MFLSNFLKAVMMLTSLEGSGEALNIDQALNYFDNQVHCIQNYYGIVVDEEAKKACKAKIYNLTNKGGASAEQVQKIVTELLYKLKLIINPYGIINLPNILANLPGIYHFKANMQTDGFSCGYWTLANAKAIDDFVNNYEPGKPLVLEEINSKSRNIIQALLNRVTSELPGAEHINYYAINEESCRLNEISLPNLKTLCKIQDLNDYSSDNFRRVCNNKLHIVRLMHTDADPCCFAANEVVYLYKYQEIMDLINRMKESDFLKIEYFIINSLKEICGPIIDEICAPMRILTSEEIENKKGQITNLNWDYLSQLMEDLDKITQTQVISLMIDSLITDEDLKNIISTYCKKNELPYELALDDQDKKFLTLCNLFWAIQNVNNQKNIICLQNIGRISRLVYFKSLSDNFKELINSNQAGALHFSCQVGVHWILISVINLPDRKPFLVILDSTNEKINFALYEEQVALLYEVEPNLPFSAEQFDLLLNDELININDEQINLLLNERENVQEIYRLISPLRIKYNKNMDKIFYILFFYDLFINGNGDRIDIPLENELSKLNNEGSFDNNASLENSVHDPCIVGPSSLVINSSEEEVQTVDPSEEGHSSNCLKSFKMTYHEYLDDSYDEYSEEGSGGEEEEKETSTNSEEEKSEGEGSDSPNIKIKEKETSNSKLPKGQKSYDHEEEQMRIAIALSKAEQERDINVSLEYGLDDTKVRNSSEISSPRLDNSRNNSYSPNGTRKSEVFLEKNKNGKSPQNGRKNIEAADLNAFVLQGRVLVEGKGKEKIKEDDKVQDLNQGDPRESL